MVQKQLSNMMIINELLYSICPRWSRKRAWKKGLGRRMGYDEYTCDAILFAKQAQGDTPSAWL